MTAHVVPDPVLSPDLLERVLLKLGLTDQPRLDLTGLNRLFAAYQEGVPFDNIQKRIWFAGDRSKPVTGGDPTEFFEHWLTHGTGGTCFPINGALHALVHSLGFDARRNAGSVIVEGYPAGGNHGTVLVTLDGVDYLIDGNLGAFKALPLLPDTPTSTGDGLHDIRAVPLEGRFDVLWYQGHSREAPLVFRTELEYDSVDHAFFLARYDWTTTVGLFNDALYICRRLPESIMVMGRTNKITVATNNTLTKTEITEAERRRALVEEFGMSVDIANALPPDVLGGAALL